MGDHIRTWRQLQRLPQKVVAERAGISISTLRRIEQGDPGISLEALMRVARGLGQLDALASAIDPLHTDLGRLLAEQSLPRRVR